MKSMTGFGQAVGTLPSSFGVRAEISSINRKQLEAKVTLPRELSCHEIEIRNRVGQRVSRGSVSVKIDLVNSAGVGIVPSGAKINFSMASDLYRQAKELAGILKSDQVISVSDLLLIPGVVEVTSADFHLPEFEKVLFQTLDAALDQLIGMRAAEGLNLKHDIADRITFLRNCLAQILEPVKCNPVLQQERLLQRLKDSGLTQDPGDERFLKEVVFFLDRADVSEEITRLNSHFTQFDTLLSEDEKPVGRSLDFLVQETFREINTLGNKAASVEVSPVIVKMKTELEKIREQVQNVE